MLSVSSYTVTITTCVFGSRARSLEGIILNVVVGLIGAVLAGWVISPLVGVGTINQDVFNVGALLVSLIGAVILLALINLFRRDPVN